MANFVFDISIVETDPGHPESPFSPPEDWTGSLEDYRGWLRTQFKASPWVRQRLAIAARRYQLKGPLDVRGRFGSILPSILTSMLEKIRAEPSFDE
ncbi:MULTISPECIES: hypothetical protein [Methylomonas]|nr:hypothetical protein [Methylomonas koyamae]